MKDSYIRGHIPVFSVYSPNIPTGLMPLTPIQSSLRTYTSTGRNAVSGLFIMIVLLVCCLTATLFEGIGFEQ